VIAPQSTGPHAQSGFALVASLLAIVLIAALVAGALFATTEDTKIGATGMARDVAMLAAESAVASTVGNTASIPSIVGLAGTTAGAVDESGIAVAVFVTRLDSTNYVIVADATPDASHAGARRRIGLLAVKRTAVDGSVTLSPIADRSWFELF
jgi:Tfp pilus assembly protein PilX